MYYLVYGLLYLVSLLPLRILYLISDFAYFVLYYIIGYRKEIVRANLTIAFPERSEAERKKIAKKFYKNFVDNFIEVVKLVSASPAYIGRHFYGDYSLFASIHQQGKRCQVLFSHNFNWEWACLNTPLCVQQSFLVVYMPVSNSIFDRIINKVRARTGAIMLPATNMQRAILPHRNKLYILALVADQNPGDPSRSHWIKFFGKPAPFVTGPESGARRGNIPVLFTSLTRERRGYYKIIFEMGEEFPARLPVGELTRKYVRHMEKFIAQSPETWLWSHRRWKWEWKEGFPEILE